MRDQITPAWRNDAYAKVTGKAKYTDDMKMIGMLHAVPVYSEYVSARINGIDASEAIKMPGVVNVFTAKDIPGNKVFGQIIKDYQILADEYIKSNGDVIAIVVAETRVQAISAIPFVKLDATELPAVLDPEAALLPGSPLVHPEHGSNIANYHCVRTGDVEIGETEADIVIEQDFSTSRIEHAYLEPESGLCYLRQDGVMECIGSMQHPFSTRRFVATVLGKPLSDVEVKTVPMGGGFGGKDDTAALVCARAALAALLTGRPVKMTYSREMSMQESYKRHPYKIHYRMGLKQDGHIVFVKVRMVADGGAYCSVTPWVTWRSTVQCCGAYTVPHVHCDVYGMYTNNIFCGAMRGFGSPQVNFAIEQLMEMAAEALNQVAVPFTGTKASPDPVAVPFTGAKATPDPVAVPFTGAKATPDPVAVPFTGAKATPEPVTLPFTGTNKTPGIDAQNAPTKGAATIDEIDIRRINMVRQGSVTITGQKLDQHTVSLEQVLDIVLKESDYYNKRKLCAYGKTDSEEMYGIGLAMSYRGMSLGAEGTDFNSAIISVQPDGSILLETGIHENGQGSESAMILLCAEHLAVDKALIRYRQPSTSNIPDGGTTVASRGTIMGGGAVVNAAVQLKAHIARIISKDLNCQSEEVIFENGIIYNRNAGVKPAATIPELIHPLNPSTPDLEAVPFTGTQSAGKSLTWQEAIRLMYSRQEYPYSFGVFQAPKVSWDEHTGQGNAYFTWVYACQAVELTVNAKTGKITLLNMIAAHDVGKAVNPAMLKGQFYGGMVMGAGYGMQENCEVKDGKVVPTNLHQYRILRSTDIPEMTAIVVENHDPLSPSGAKGIGEPTLEIMAPAIANAVYRATGKRYTDQPVKI